MPQFGQLDGFEPVSLITGPSHVFLGIQFGDGQPKLIKRPRVGSCQHGVLDETRILESVCAGLNRANAECNSSLNAAAVMYVENDSPRYEMYERCAYLIGKHLSKDAES